MTGRRYIALIASNPAARSVWEQATGVTLAAHPGFEKQLAGSRLALVAEPSSALALGSEGFVVGDLFEPGRAQRLTEAGTDESRAIIVSRGERLVAHYWGSYIALIASRERETVEIVRGPLGDLGCYVTRGAHGILIASDVDLLRAFAGFAPLVDWASLTRLLADGDLLRRRTCLGGLDELAGGERLTELAGRRAVDEVWSPWDLVGPDRRRDDPAEAAYHLRQAVLTAVAARVPAPTRVVLRLSGGLDSSIVAASLAHLSRSFVAVTMTTRDRSGDERVHARAVAEHLGVNLIEVLRDPARVDLTASAASGLPRPMARSFAQASLRAAADVARAHGATAIVDGGGGDNMFASLQSPAAAADCLDVAGGAGHFWATARSLGIATSTGTLHVARRALLRRWTRGPAYRWSVDLSLLSARARVIVNDGADHPWLATPPGVLAGSAAHIALLVGAQSVVQSRDPRARLPNLSPLIAQPVAEACLRVPSWRWTREGYDRVAARDAFRAMLPPAIVARRDKGTPDSFVVELVERNSQLIRTMLIDGLLARHELLDLSAVELALMPARLATGFGFARIMRLVDAEAWVRSWG